MENAYVFLTVIALHKHDKGFLVLLELRQTFER